MKKLVIVPAYNEMGSILKTIHDIEENAPDFDYIVINDCSTDDTLKILKENHKNYLSLPVNLGIGGAVQTGYLYALKNDYDVAVQFDGDGQHSASYLEAMCKKMLEENADMVIGSRFISKQGFQSSGTRRLGIKYFTILIKALTRNTITDPTSGMRMIGKDLIQQFAKEYPKDYPEPESVVKILASKRKVVELPVIMNEREEGVSSISPTKSIYYMLKVTLAVLLARLG